MATTSSGLLLWRRRGDVVEVLLGHMGGPYWAGRDDGAWTIPKGLADDGESVLQAAEREFAEELGHAPPPPDDDRPDLDLGEVTRSGKHVRIVARHGNFDPDTADHETTPGGTFELEWPPNSGRRQRFPELDRVSWFDLATARARLAGNQQSFIDRLVDAIGT